MIDLRLRTRISDAELEQKVGKILTDDDYNVLLTRDAAVRRPDGKLMAIFMKGIVPPEVIDQAYPVLHSLKSLKSVNRGLASGTLRVSGEYSKRTDTKPIASSLLGAFEKAGSMNYCRLTAWTGQQAEKFVELQPLFRFIGDQMRERVPDRYEAQMREVRRTDPAWVIPGTPFTTVTVNNTYPTGVHRDAGDLDAGFSNLLVVRRGIVGGRLVWPRYRLAVEADYGDLLLMDAHEWHGNTRIYCQTCGEELDNYHRADDHDAERISVVCYFRTKMVKCGTPADEAEKAKILQEQRNLAAMGQ